MRRFFLGSNRVVEGRAVITGTLFHHMARVLRLTHGAQLILCDGESCEYCGTIIDIGSDSLVAEVGQATATRTTESPRITLFQGLPKGEKMELILQKAAELGVAAVVPFVAERSVSRPDAAKGVQKVRRWTRIVEEAARQSCRPDIPRLFPIMSMQEALSAAEQELKLLLWEGEREQGIGKILGDHPMPREAAVMVGPEGGLSPAEAAAAEAHGFLPATLGTRILRTETASLAALTIMNFYWGDLG